MRSRRLTFVVFAFAACALICLPENETARSQETKGGERKITVSASTPGSAVVTVTLFRDGKAIATQDLRTSDYRHSFLSLPRGDYELHFEALQHTALVKKVALQDFDTELRGELTKGAGTVAVGGGPSLHELEARVKKLEETVARLQSK